MKFGTRLKLKKDWEVGIIDFEVGDIFYVASYTQKYGMKLHHDGVIDLIDFYFSWENRDKKIDEYFEVMLTDGELIEDYKQRMFDNNTKAQNIISELRLEIDELRNKDRLAELEKKIKDWFIKNGLNNAEIDWFTIKISTQHKKKLLFVYDIRNRYSSKLLIVKAKTTKEMFDKAFEFFKIAE